MKPLLTGLMVAVAWSASLMPSPATANQTITCESRHQEYNTCRIQSHGYVRLKRQTSNAACIQGRSWDYDKRHIWVDGNCKGIFEVETRHYYDDDYYDHNNKNNHSSSDTGKVVAAAAAVAIIAGIAAAASKNKNKEEVVIQDRYADDNYYGSRHSSYVPRWMVGDFEGYNTHEKEQIDMTITDDGRMTAYVKGIRLLGYVNDDKLFIGDSEFYIKNTGNGFTTTQVGHYNNVVQYTRTD